MGKIDAYLLDFIDFIFSDVNVYVYWHPRYCVETSKSTDLGKGISIMLFLVKWSAKIIHSLETKPRSYPKAQNMVSILQ